MRALIPLLVPCLLWCVEPQKEVKPKGKASRGGKRQNRPVNAREARVIAERETGGQAVSARAIPLNGATGGWEVEVRMAKEDWGWLCIIDNDTRGVFRKTRIPNPQARKAPRKR